MKSETGVSKQADVAAKTAALSPAKRALLQRRLKERAASPKENPILRRNQAVAPLSFAQELLWLVDQLAPDKVNYTVPRIMRLKGELNVPALERTLTTIVERHEVLRTSIVVATDGTPVQKLRPAVPISIRVIDLQSEPESSRIDKAMATLKELIRHPFDLSRDDLLRPTVLRLASDDQIFLLESHHIASDGWSKGVLFDELEKLYAANCTNEPLTLPELPIQYSDYAIWQRETMSEAVLENELTYWRSQLGGALALLEFPSAKRRPPVQTFEGKGQRFQFSKDLLDSAQQFSKRESVTLFMTLLAAFDAFVSRYTGQTDLVIGTPIAGRNRPEQENLIGYFTNTLALRTDLSGDPTFREIVKRVRLTSLSSYEHQDLPFEILVKELRPDRTLSYSPVFQVMFSVGHAVQAAPRLLGLEASPVFVERGTSRFDLLFGATALPEGLALACEYNTDLFEDGTIRQMVSCFETLLVAALADPERRLSQLPLLKPDELRQQVVDWNDTTAAYPDACIHTLFEAQVARTPAAVAVQDERESLTYQELDRRANQITRWLEQSGARIETPIAVCLNRSTTFAAVLLGVLKAGCACVLLDPSLPGGRLQQIAEDADVLVFLTEKRLKDRLGSFARTVFIDAEKPQIDRHSGERLNVPLSPDNLAFILYTSGSTGQPKGVLLEHRGLVNHHTTVAREFGLTIADRVLQFSLLGFDICLEEMFPTWLTGGTVVFRSDVISGREFLAWLGRHRITVMDVPTAFWHEWVHDLKSMNARPPDCLRLLIVGGERASRTVHSLWREIVGRDVRWLNTYGPTEASIIATAYEPALTETGDEKLDIPIGRPIANTQVHILDGCQQPVPIGVPGELYLGGVGLARGYLNRHELSAEKFVANPFVPGGRLYRTGDLARYRADGNIEFVGRADDQIKIRGFRVEPGEVQAVLAREPGVQQNVVVGASGPPPQLIAYVVPMPGMALDISRLREGLQRKFPMYMVPAAFIVLEALPMTAQGKLDRSKLPAPEVVMGTTEASVDVGPRGASEEALIGIWERVLNRHPIQVHDDFFEIGGHSLLAVRLLAAIRTTFGTELPLATLFTARTVSALAAVIDGDNANPRLSTVIPIQSGGSRLPLFCVSRPNVNALGYVFLARHLGPDQPVYGLQGTLRQVTPRPFTQSEYEEKAKEYIAAMREIQPAGPYLLIGNCEGAHIAFEMSRQLQARGEKVGFLGVLDAWPQENTRRYHLFILHYYGRHIRELAKAGNRWSIARKQFGRIVKLALRRLRFTPTTPSPVAESDLMMRRYWPETGWQIPKSSSRVILFRVRKQPYWRIPDSAMGWRERATGGVEVIDVPGQHATILREPGVRVIAKHVADRITRATGTDDLVSARPRGDVVPMDVRSRTSGSAQPTPTPSKSVLMLCYLYPPILTSGTTRSLAFSSHLRHFGWEPKILTVAKSRSGYPVGEPVPPDLKILRSLEFNLQGAVDFLQGVTNKAFQLFGSELQSNLYRELFCLPDAQLAWICLPKAILEMRSADVIYVSCSPFSSALTGCMVKILTGKPLVVDFRDAWLLNPYNKLGRLQEFFAKRVEPWVLRHCDKLILNTNGAAALYKRVYSQWAHKITCIPNGYDSITPASRSTANREPFTIMHIGSFYGSRNPRLLLEALTEINNPAIQFVHLGAPCPELDAFRDRLNVVALSAVPHNEALEMMKRASLLYLKQGHEDAANNYIAVAAKTYEYLATGLPILAEGPEGDNIDIVRRYATTSYLVTSNTREDLKAALLRAYEEQDVEPRISPEFVRDFDRRHLTARLAAVLNDVTGRAQSDEFLAVASGS